MEFLTAGEWDQFTKTNSQMHILQTAAWGKLKEKFGWSPKFIRQDQVGAMILVRRLPLRLSVAYIPRGPVGSGAWSDLWPAVDNLCRQEKAVFLRVEPDLWQPISDELFKQQFPGFVRTGNTIQPPRTVLIDLQDSEEDILMRMKSKTRYNIRLAKRKNVVIKSSTDVEIFHRMSLTTGKRDEFGVHNLSYYQRAYDLFALHDDCILLIAEFDGQPLAGLMAFIQGETAWYFYGASTDQERNRMPAYLLQWEAIRWAKQKGCKVYDMWGVPDFPVTILEEEFLNRSDGLWGVYRFKRGFGGEICRTVGAWDRVYHPISYKLYELVFNHRKPRAA